MPELEDNLNRAREIGRYVAVTNRSPLTAITRYDLDAVLRGMGAYSISSYNNNAVLDAATEVAQAISEGRAEGGYYFRGYCIQASVGVARYLGRDGIRNVTTHPSVIELDEMVRGAAEYWRVAREFIARFEGGEVTPRRRGFTEPSAPADPSPRMSPSEFLAENALEKHVRSLGASADKLSARDLEKLCESFDFIKDLILFSDVTVVGTKQTLEVLKERLDLRRPKTSHLPTLWDHLQED